MGIGVIGTASGGTPSKIFKTEKITSTQSWTAPDDVTSVDLLMCGGGGGGGRYSSAGRTGSSGSGSVDEFLNVPVTPGETYTLTIGSGGNGANSSNAGGGNATSFGNLRTIAGGGGGRANFAEAQSNAAYGPVGRGGYPTWIFSTNNTEAQSNASSGYKGLGGGGTASIYDRQIVPRDGGGPGSNTNNLAAHATENTGGGGGTVNSQSVGGNGGSGVIYISYWTEGA